jgi:DNA-binding LacI/PurR family transcriptional regulator
MSRSVDPDSIKVQQAIVDVLLKYAQANPEQPILSAESIRHQVRDCISNLKETDLRNDFRALKRSKLIQGLPGKGYSLAEVDGLHINVPAPKRKSTRLIAFLFPDFKRTYFSRASLGIEKYLRQYSNGEVMLVVHRTESLEDEQRLLLHLKDRCEGIILASQATEAIQVPLDQLKEAKCALVCIDRRIPYLDGVITSTLDNYLAGQRVAEKFDKFGFPFDRKFVFSSCPDNMATIDRVRGFSHQVCRSNLGVIAFGPDEYVHLMNGGKTQDGRSVPASLCWDKESASFSLETMPFIIHGAFRKFVPSKLDAKSLVPIVHLSFDQMEYAGKDLATRVLPGLLEHMAVRTDGKIDPISTFFVNDWVCFGLYEVQAQLSQNEKESFQIGREVHVIGLDGFSSVGLSPSLISVKQSPELQARSACESLFKLVDVYNNKPNASRPISARDEEIQFTSDRFPITGKASVSQYAVKNRC